MTPEIIRGLRDHERRLAYEETLESMAALPRIMPGGRLTLTSGTAVTTSDVTGAGTLYYTPYLHNQVWLYTSSAWRLYTFTQRSLSLTLTSGKNYDVFLYDNSGTLTLELSAAWTNDTTRADALTTQDGVTVKSGALDRLWLGTIRASGTNTTEDSLTRRFVWNLYNAVMRPMEKRDTTSSWTYNSTTIRQTRADTNNKFEFVIGYSEFVEATYKASLNNPGFVAIGLDSTTASSSNSEHGSNVSTTHLDLDARYSGYPVSGYHYLAMLEAARNAVTFTSYGVFVESGNDLIRTGMRGSLMA